MRASSIPGAKALAQLVEGNRRFATGQLQHPHQDAARRAEILPGQSPLAVVLCCSDSRVPPEVVFDQGLGDLFVVRTAGHVLDAAVLASVEYAVDHLGTRLVLVLGHARCGAVAAALSEGDHHGHLGGLIVSLRSELAKDGLLPGALAEPAERRHVAATVEQLRALPGVAAVAPDEVAIRGAYFHLDNGVVELLQP